MLVALMAAHALVYFRYEDRGLVFVGPLAVILSVVVALQLAGAWKRRRKQAQTSPVDSNMALH